MSVRGVDALEAAAVLAFAAFAAWTVRRSGGSRLAASVRLLVAAALGGALAAPIGGPAGSGSHRTVYVVDRSESVGSGRSSAEAGGGPGQGGDEDGGSGSGRGSSGGGRADAALGPTAAATGHDAPGQRRPLEIVFGDEASSDLAAALDLGGRLAGDGGRIVVLSDGHATGGEPVRTAAEIASRGVRIDVVALPSRFDVPGDVAVAGIDGPEVVRVGDPFSILAGVRGTGPAEGELVARIEGREIVRRPFVLDTFERAFALALPAPDSIGALAIDVEVVAEGDVHPDNDRASIHVGVVAPPSALVVGEGTAVVSAAGILEAGGVTTTISGPARVPIRAEDIAVHDALVLVDVPARALALDQRAAIEAAVETLGIGLVLSGGRQSFALGDWRGTALERLSPLTMDPAPRASREPVTLVLLLDRSASMGGGDGRVTKLDLAREATLLAAEALEPHDRIGVAAYADAAEWLIEPREVGVGLSLAELHAALFGVVPAGGTRILGALELGLAALGSEPGQTRHAVLLSDGRDLESDLAPSRAAVAAGAEAGLTLSTIALGVDADADFLGDLAAIGRGRYHAAREPGDLPRLLLEEGEIVGGQVERRTRTKLVQADAHRDPDFQAVDLADLPEITGHLALEPRPEAEARRIFDSAEGDPVLVAGQRGLGLVVAWTSDFGDDWTAEWREHPAAVDLFGRMVRAVAAPPVPPAFVRSEPSTSGAVVMLDITDAPLDDPNLEARLVITASNGVTRSIELGPGALGSLEAAVDLDPGQSAIGRIEVFEPGSDSGRGTAGRDIGSGETAARVGAASRVRRWPIALRRDPNPERLPQPDPDNVLSAIARAGDGRSLEGPGALDGAPAADVEGSRALWPYLAGLAAFLWPLDVALRIRSTRRAAPWAPVTSSRHFPNDEEGG